MALSRRNFLADASALGMLAALLPELAAQTPSMQAPASAEDLPHDSYNFWNGFFDSVNPYSQTYGNKTATRGAADQLPDPAAQTQYLHYDATRKGSATLLTSRRRSCSTTTATWASVSRLHNSVREQVNRISRLRNCASIPRRYIPSWTLSLRLPGLQSRRLIRARWARFPLTSWASSLHKRCRARARFCSHREPESWLSTYPGLQPNRCL